MFEEMMRPSAAGILLVVFVALSLICGSLSALIERSGPIRLRHWGQNAGGQLAVLQCRTRRFEVYRLLLSFLARLAVVGLFWAAFLTVSSLDVPRPLLTAVGLTSLVLGVSELVNRVLVGSNPEVTLERFTFLFRFSYLLLQPIVLLLVPFLPTGATRRSEDDSPDEASDEEIEAFIDVGAKEGIIDSSDEDMILRVIDFGDSIAKSVMTPRMDMICTSITIAFEDLVALFVASKHSRIPLYEESIDSIVGVIHIRDLLPILQRPGEVNLREVAHKPHFVPETKRLDKLLSELQALHQTLAIVVDEFGGTAGLVTIEDLLEEIVGEIVDEDEATGPENEHLGEGVWRIQATTSLSDLGEIFELTIEDGAYETVGGLIFGGLETVPRPGEKIESYGLRFEVETVANRRVLSAIVGPKETDVPEET